MSWRNREDWDRQRREANNERFSTVLVKGLVVLHITDKAFLVIEKDTLESLRASGESTSKLKHWIPFSQIKSSSIPLKEIDKDDEVEFWLPLWLVQEKGLLY